MAFGCKIVAFGAPARASAVVSPQPSRATSFAPGSRVPRPHRKRW